MRVEVNSQDETRLHRLPSDPALWSETSTNCNGSASKRNIQEAPTYGVVSYHASQSEGCNTAADRYIFLLPPNGINVPLTCIQNAFVARERLRRFL